MLERCASRILLLAAILWLGCIPPAFGLRAPGAGALGGGIGAEIQGGGFWNGAALGAVGGAAGYALLIDVPDNVINAQRENPRVHLWLDIVIDVGFLIYDVAQGNWKGAAISAGAMPVPGISAPMAKAGIAAAKGADDLAKLGRSGKSARLRELATDPNVSSADRGWIRQELNAIERGQRTNIRIPPGNNLAH